MNAVERDVARRFSETYEACYGRVHAYAQRRVGREAADEVAAETFLVAWRRFDVLPPQPLPWLYGVARNVVLRHRVADVRREAARQALEPEATCGPRLAGRRYMLLDHVQANGPANLSRQRIPAILQQHLRRGKIPVQTARRIDDDLAAASDSFLANLNNLMRYGTMTTALTPEGVLARVPPPGVPGLLVCVPDGRAISCRDLNGDDQAAVGSGIYQALPTGDWVPAPAHQQEPGWRLEVAILGHSPTTAEFRLLRDFVMAATTGSSHSSYRVQPAPARSH